MAQSPWQTMAPVDRRLAYAHFGLPDPRTVGAPAPSEAELMAQRQALYAEQAPPPDVAPAPTPDVAPAPTPASQGTLDQMNQAATAGGPAQPQMDEYGQLIRQMDERGQANLAGKRESLADMERMLQAAANRETQVDLSPLMALADTWYGGNIQQGYARPTTGREHMSDVVQLQQGLAKSRGDISDSEMAMLGAKLQNLYKEKELGQRLEELKLRKKDLGLRAKEVDALKNLKFEQEMREDFNKASAQARGLVSFKAAIKPLQQFIRDKGIPEVGTAEFATYSSLYNDAKTAYKDAKALGALTASDVTITEGVLGPESAIDFAKYALMKGGREGVIASFDTVEKQTDAAFARERDNLGQVFPLDPAKPLIRGLDERFRAIGGAPAKQAVFTVDEVKAMTDDEVRAAYLRSNP